MKYWKRIFILFLLGLAIVYPQTKALAHESSPPKTLIPTVSFCNNKYSLLEVYENQTEAFTYYKDQYPTTLLAIQTSYALPALTEENIDNYIAILPQLKQQTPEEQDIARFLDIYENPKINKVTIEKLNELEKQVSNNTLTEYEATGIAKLFLPTKPENNNDKPVYFSKSDEFNLKAAQDYAEKHARPGTYNREYGYETKLPDWVPVPRDLKIPVDCTNFASQILHAGGINMVHSDSVHKGWWFKAPGNRSDSWCNAHVFKNYMGSGYSTKYWNQFVANLKAGDFIAVDITGDGQVDHIGFVHSKNGDQVRIAQHSADYIEWDNNWPNANGVGVYFRVRR